MRIDYPIRSVIWFEVFRVWCVRGINFEIGDRMNASQVKMQRTPAVSNVLTALADDRNSRARQERRDSPAQRDRRIHEGNQQGLGEARGCGESEDFAAASAAKRPKLAADTTILKDAPTRAVNDQCLQGEKGDDTVAEMLSNDDLQQQELQRWENARAAKAAAKVADLALSAGTAGGGGSNHNPESDKSKENLQGISREREKSQNVRDTEREHVRRGLPRTGSGESPHSLHSRGSSKRSRADSPRTDSPRTESPGVHRDVNPEVRSVLPPVSEGCARVEEVISKAATRNALCTGLLTIRITSAQDEALPKACLLGASVSAAQVLRALRQLFHFRVGENKEGNSVVDDEEMRLVETLAQCLTDKSDELQDISSLLSALNVLIAVDYFPPKQNVERSSGAKILMASLVKVAVRMAFDLKADEVVRMFAGFGRVGRDAGQVLESYAILKRTENLMSSMRPDQLSNLVESLHQLDSDLPEKFADKLCAELKRKLRDNRVKVAADTNLLTALVRMRRLTNRKDLIQMLADKMRGHFQNFPAYKLAESILLLAEGDIMVNTAVLHDVAKEAKLRADQGILCPRHAADILWALRMLDWREERNGDVALTLADAAVRCIVPNIEEGEEATTWSPWSPTVHDNQDSGAAGLVNEGMHIPQTDVAEGAAQLGQSGSVHALPNDVSLIKDATTRDSQDEANLESSACSIRRDAQELQSQFIAEPADKATLLDEVSADTKYANTTNANAASSTIVDHSKLTDVATKVSLITHNSCNGGAANESNSLVHVVPNGIPGDAATALFQEVKHETSTDGVLGSLGAARLLFTLEKMGLTDKARAVFKIVENILALGYLDLEARELADMLFALTKMDVTVCPFLQCHLCLAATLCMKKLTAGEIAVTIKGLVHSGSALPVYLLDALAMRIRAVRRGLSTTNCINLLHSFLICRPTAVGDETAAHVGVCVEAEQVREWKLRKQLVREVCEESSNLADKLDVKGMTQVMQAVATFGLKLSAEDAQNFSRRALALQHGAGSSGGGDRRAGGRGTPRGGGYESHQLVRIIGGFIASGLCFEDTQNGSEHAGRHCAADRGSTNVVVVLCDELRGRVGSLSVDVLADAFVAVAVGGAAPNWNALDLVDGLSANVVLPKSAVGSKTAAARRELLLALLEALCSKKAELQGRHIADVVCACALAAESCSAGELMHDKRVVAMLHESGNNMAHMDPRRGCALLCVFAMRHSVPSKRALASIVSRVVAKSSKLTNREIALAVHAIAVLNQEGVALKFGTLADEGVARLNAKLMSDLGLRSLDIAASGPLHLIKSAQHQHGMPAIAVSNVSDKALQCLHADLDAKVEVAQRHRSSSEHRSASGLVDMEAAAQKQLKQEQLKQTLSSASMILWAQAVMSQYPHANAQFFVRTKVSRVTWDDASKDLSAHLPSPSSQQPASNVPPDRVDALMAEQAPAVSSLEHNPLAPVNCQESSSKDTGALPSPEALLLSKLVRVWLQHVDQTATPCAQDSLPLLARDTGAVDSIMGEDVLVRLHQVFMGLKMAGKNVEQELALGGEGRVPLEGEHVQRLCVQCRVVFVQQQQQHDAQRRTEYTSEICEAAADLAFHLEQGLFDEATGLVLGAGNAHRKVAVDVLSHDDVVEGEDTGTPLLKGALSLRRRLLEFSKWNVVQLQLSSWLLVRHNNVEKKKFLFRADRLRSYAGTPAWCDEGAVANALQSVDGCVPLIAFLEMILCTHTKGLQTLDSLMVTSCFRKMALPPHPSPPQKQPPSVTGACSHAMALHNADSSLKMRVEDLLSNSGLQARALDLVEQLSFSDSHGVLVSIAQVWKSLGSPRGALHQPLLVALCDKIAQEVAPNEMTCSAAERLARALLDLAVPPSGESELPLAALKAGVGAALSRCRETSSAAAATGTATVNRFVTSLDGDAATALVNAAALLVPLSPQHIRGGGSAGAKHRDGGLFAVEEVWGIEADNWLKQPMCPDESVTVQVKALARRLSSLVSSGSLSAAHIVQLVRAFARGTPRDTWLFRSLMARLSELVAADTTFASGATDAKVCALDANLDASMSVDSAVSAASSRAGTGLDANDLLELVTSSVRHGLHIHVLPAPLVQRLQHPCFLAEISYDAMLSLLWCMGWGAFWDAHLWLALVQCVHDKGARYFPAEPRLTGKNSDNDTGMGNGSEHVLLQVKRDVMLLWAVSAVDLILVCAVSWSLMMQL